MLPHISERLADHFAEDGWDIQTSETGLEAKKSLAFDHLAGTVSRGLRVVTLRIDATGRWLERVDGWGKVEADLDLRNYWSQPAAEAVKDILATV